MAHNIFKCVRIKTHSREIRQAAFVSPSRFAVEKKKKKKIMAVTRLFAFYANLVTLISNNTHNGWKVWKILGFINLSSRLGLIIDWWHCSTLSCTWKKDCHDGQNWATKPFLRPIKMDDIMKIESLRYGKICGDRALFHEIINMSRNKWKHETTRVITCPSPLLFLRSSPRNYSRK